MQFIELIRNSKVCLYLRNKYPILDHFVLFGKKVTKAPNKSIVFFPLLDTTFHCGLSGIVSVKGIESQREPDLSGIETLIDSLNQTFNQKNMEVPDQPLASRRITELYQSIMDLKSTSNFTSVYLNKKSRNTLESHTVSLENLIIREESAFKQVAGNLSSETTKQLTENLRILKDTWWILSKEVSENISKTENLIYNDECKIKDTLGIYYNINSVLNGIDRLEVRGRDSAGISLLFTLTESHMNLFQAELAKLNLAPEFKSRISEKVLKNGSISLVNQTRRESSNISIAFTYKVAAEIGSLGDNISFIRKQIKSDEILYLLTSLKHVHFTATAHTRWASIGAITEANCHPTDNVTEKGKPGSLIHVCLNGDIDNYLDLKHEFEKTDDTIPAEITTDTKIIAIQIETYLQEGCDITEAFIKAVSRFKGSHAISMHTNLAPGKIFLGQKGSGQAVFIGLAEDRYIHSSEVYGFVEVTNNYIKIDGEKEFESEKGKTQGQVFVLNQNSPGGLAGIKTYYYDGTEFNLTNDAIKKTEITTRDIDRQNFSHYFMKEISEAPESVKKTLRNKWKISEEDENSLRINLDESVIPKSLQQAIEEGTIKRVYFAGQGTAGVAALACANILKHYLSSSDIDIKALKASELSGFEISGFEKEDSMADTLVVAISQSGTTTDTNKTVDMVKNLGARTLAIVNRRDSDLTFKTEGVLYTSSGRDIEMSVASTKAFYSQIVAGALLSLFIVKLAKKRNRAFISEELKNLRKLPNQMRQVFQLKDQIEQSAQRHALKKTYWAAVGSGPNKASADEIRIKLSELCYKTISSDFVEDKKHIDLSSEPLIIICAAGTRDEVAGDIIKDTAIFHAHKAIPIVITQEGEDRFNSYSTDIFKVPVVSEHIAPILNTLVGHLWGFYAARAINSCSEFFYKHRENIQKTVDDFKEEGLDFYEVILEKKFREATTDFYREYRRKQIDQSLPSETGKNTSTDITLLLKYLSGRLPITDFEFDFGVKGTPANMMAGLMKNMNDIINFLARPVDAIKHQAKTVTVGTSRESEIFSGILFDLMEGENINISQITHKNVIVLRNIQDVIHKVKGYLIYGIKGLDVLGEITDNSRITVEKKTGILKNIHSRIDEDRTLKGTKHIIVKEGNVHIGKGLKDGRSLIVIPIISDHSKGPGKISKLLSVNILFKENISLETRIKALGGKYTRIKEIVQENSFKWDDTHLDNINTKDLFGDSAEIIGNRIINKLSNL